MNHYYDQKSKDYTGGVQRIDTLLFSWATWMWYRRYMSGDEYSLNLKNVSPVFNLADSISF